MAKHWAGTGMAQGDRHELACLKANNTARTAFRNSLLTHATDTLGKAGKKLTRADVELLRSDYTYVIAEFFYSAMACQLTEEARLRNMLEDHNAAMERLIADKERLEFSGLSLSVVKEAKLSKTNIENIVYLNSSPGERRWLILNQRSLASLTIQHMARESNRTTIVELERLGFLKRTDIGDKLINTQGVLEGYFRKHLGVIAKHLKLTSGDAPRKRASRSGGAVESVGSTS